MILAYVVQPHRETQDYVHALECLKKAGYTPSFVMCDCEIAIRKAALATWPDVEIRACRFHVMQVS